MQLSATCEHFKAQLGSNFVHVNETEMEFKFVVEMAPLIRRNLMEIDAALRGPGPPALSQGSTPAVRA